MDEVSAEASARKAPRSTQYRKLKGWKRVGARTGTNRPCGSGSRRIYEQLDEIIVTLETSRLCALEDDELLPDEVLPDVPVAVRPLSLLVELPDGLALAVLLVLDGDEAEALADACRPLTWILWPTCLARSELSPVSRHVSFAADWEDPAVADRDAVVVELPLVPVADAPPAGAIIALLRT